MTPDQLLKLQELREKLFDVVLLEVDPVNWTGGGKPPKELSQSERGDAVWCRKQAAASLALLSRVHQLTQGNPSGEPLLLVDEPADFEQEIKEAMESGDRMLQRLRVVK